MNAPNPGSAEARERGCTCPVYDNCRGNGYLGLDGVFVMRKDCPLHGQATTAITAPASTQEER